MGKYLLKSLLIFMLLFFGNNTLLSQEKKLKKAKEQYDKYQYIDAQETYLKVAEKGYKSADLFMNLGDSYYFNSQFEDALKWYEKLVNSYPDQVEPEYYFRYAQTLKTVERYEDSDTYMQKFAAANGNDQRAKLFLDGSDYLKRIDFQSDRFEIENTSINSSFVEFGTAFYGKNIVFSSSRDTLTFKKAVHQWNGEAFLNLFEAEYDSINNSFSKIRRFDGKINSKFHESTPVFTKDRRTIYFTRNNFEEGKLGRDQRGTNKLKIYRSYKNPEGGWTTPHNLPFNSDEYSVAHPTLSSDEKTLYFSSDMPGGKGLSDLYEVAINGDGSFEEPKNLGDRINTEGKETFPYVGADNELYFSSDGHMGLGGLDVYVTKINPQTDKEKLIVNIGRPINGPKDDFAFIIDENTKKGYFSSNRGGGKGSDDIYSFIELEELKDFCEITIAGLVTDKDTNELLSGAKVSIYDKNNNLIQSFVVSDEAAYSQLVECESSYFVRAEKEEYDTLEKLVNTSDKSQIMDTPLALEKKIKSADVGDDLTKILSLKPIYFDFNGYTIRSDAKVELAKVIEVMNQYTNMKLEIRSHTDSHGEDQYNLYLSEKRAEATVNYMINNGISADRLTGKGYGETQLINDCGNDSNCKKDEYQLNRRSEFIIIK
ncbi:outer membrane protein OmpA-like peptidoglycan-associated protein [Aquimarina sp. MAR_2010_214]|uniref:OmpA family protein n=1 Tax=Aquimarina sp. MAR_2010_214 TaxID=1250026 RepID=UPI000C712528|nr:OmpA family protein [Aquimarina sp. MAR_2010_214]PKV49931.1 outer membrane protein OmpA-like peptidoglycan-associated protein [Aquimarina sp. MAR_2010_214]